MVEYNMRGDFMFDISVLVESYLEKVRLYIKNDEYTFEKRDMKNLTQLGISYKAALDIMMNLTCECYVSGPEQDHLFEEQDVFVFGEMYEEIELYIKLTFRKRDDLFIMSFHQAKYRMNYPLKNRRK
jgi:hypothetical protein